MSNKNKTNKKEESKEENLRNVNPDFKSNVVTKSNPRKK